MALSLDMSILLGYAGLIVNNLWPIVGISAGFTLGFGILSMLLGAIAHAVSHRM